MSLSGSVGRKGVMADEKVVKRNKKGGTQEVNQPIYNYLVLGPLLEVP